MDNGTDTGTGTTATAPPPPAPAGSSTTPPTSSTTPAPVIPAAQRAQSSAAQLAPQLAGLSTTAPAAAPQAPTVLQPIKRHGLAGVMDEVSRWLSGTQGTNYYIDQDGNRYVQHPPTTPAQRWRQVGLEAALGAAKGLAAGQGPGGRARAASAGLQGGLELAQKQQQQNRQDAEQDYARQRQAKIDKANLQIQQARIYQLNLENSRTQRELTEDAVKFQDYQTDRLKAMGAYPIGNGRVFTSNDWHEAAKDYPALLTDHFGNANIQPVEVADPKDPTKSIGSQLWVIPPDRMNEPVPEGTKFPTLQRSAEHPEGQTVWKTANPGTTQRQLQSYINAYDLAQKEQLVTREQAAKTQTEEVTAAHAGTKATLEEQATRARIAESRAATEEHLQTAAAKKTEAGLVAGGPNAAIDTTKDAPGTPTPAKNEAYLSTLPPALQNQIRGIANGDVKLPPASMRSKEGFALRNMVMNYDPTYTDARYETKMNFKTKGDSETLKSLSTALAHTENALQHSTELGTWPVGAPTPKASAYYEEMALLTDEMGKLVKGGAITNGQYEELKKGMDSPFQSTRNATINEATKLMGGRVAAMFQKYRAGAGEDIPLTTYFDPETQGRLQRYGMTPATGGGGAGAAQLPGQGKTFNPSAWKAANPNGDVNAATALARQQGYTIGR
jgi:hypothetical protein